MTISTETRRAGPYSGNGSTQVFAFSFKTFAAADLQVVTTTSGVDTVKTLTTHYTVSLNADQNASPGGSITMLTAPATGTTLTIISDRAFAQTLNVQNAGAFLPDAINTALDTLVVQTTQLLDQQDRTIRGALSDGVLNRLPTAAERAGGILGFDDSTGQPVVVDPSVVDALSTVAGLATEIAIVAAADVDIGTVADNIDAVNEVSEWIGGGGDAGDIEVVAEGATTALPLSEHLGWKLNFSGFDPAADGVADDAAKFLAFINALILLKVPGFVPSGDYAVSFINKTDISENLDIEFAPDANIIGLPTYQVFAGNDSITTLTVTTWTRAGTFRVVHINSLGVEDVLTAGTDYSTTGQVVDLSGGSSPFGALPTGESIRITDSEAMIVLRGVSAARKALTITGGYFDSSARGFAPATSSGAGMTLRWFNRVSISKGYYYASDTYVDAVDNGVADAGITWVDCDNFSLYENTFQGFPDIAAYGGGNSDSGVADDGYGHFIVRNRFLYCANGASVKRQGQSVFISGNDFEYCQTGCSLVATADNIEGGQGIIADNTFFRTVRRAIDVRRCDGVIVHDNRIIDFGMDIDGTTPTTLSIPAGIIMLGCSNSKIHDNIILLDTYAQDGQYGIRIGPETVYTNRECVNVDVHDNKINGVEFGISETGAGTGIVWRENEIIGTVTPVGVISGRRWQYRISNEVFEGIGTTAFAGTFTPVPTFAGGGGTVTPSTQVGRYRRQGNMVTVSCRVDFQYSGTPSGQLRITGMPYTAVALTNLNIAGSINYWGPSSGTPLTLPANTIQVTPVIPQDTTYVRFDALLSGGGVTALSVTNIAVSTTLRLEFSMTYECAQEAVN
jgi:hypothetical protein